MGMTNQFGIFSWSLSAFENSQVLSLYGSVSKMQRVGPSPSPRFFAELLVRSAHEQALATLLFGMMVCWPATVSCQKATMEHQEARRRTAEDDKAYRLLYSFGTHLQYADLLYPRNTHQTLGQYFDYPNNIYNISERRMKGLSDFLPTNASDRLKKDEAVHNPGPSKVRLERLLNAEMSDLYKTYASASPRLVEVLGKAPRPGITPRISVRGGITASMDSTNKNSVPEISTNPSFLRSVLISAPAFLSLLEAEEDSNNESPEPSEETNWFRLGPREIAYNHLLLFSVLRNQPLSDFSREDESFRLDVLFGEFAFKGVITFVLAHEMGHIVLKHPDLESVSCEQIKKNELQADAFAIVLTYARFKSLERKFSGPQDERSEDEGEGLVQAVTDAMGKGHSAFFKTVYGLAGFDKQPQCYPSPEERMAAAESIYERVADEDERGSLGLQKPSKR
jgi:hypothetical protein